MVDITIEKETQNDRQQLLDLNNHINLGKGVEVVYIYSLVDEDINYPLQSGKVLYIGEAMRKKENTGKRFQHIALSSTKGNNYISNYTLTQYYHLGKKMNLKIYKVISQRKKIEQHLLSTHLNKYGSKPIANGSTGKKCTSDYIVNLKAQSLFPDYQGLI